MATATNFAERAQPLMMRGFSVIPLEPHGKKPVPGLGAKQRTRDGAKVLDWCQQWPDANVGVCADENFVILDIDDVKAAEKAIEKCFWYGNYAVQSSPNKMHVYYRRNGFDVRNVELGQIGSLRAYNFYAVGAGSIHPAGHEYKVVSNFPVEPMPEWFYKRMLELEGSMKREWERVQWDGNRTIGEGERHAFLRTQGAKLWRGDEDETIAALIDLNEKFCEPPLDVQWITRYVHDWLYKKDICEPGPTVKLIGARTEREGYVLAPIRRFDGWFPFGAVGVVYGASGSGKSTLMLQMFDAMRRGEPFLGHATKPLKVAALVVDRPLKSLYRTLDRMGLPHDIFPACYIPANEDDKALEVAVELIREHDAEVLYIEGMDYLAADSGKLTAMKALLARLQSIADHHGVAIVGTWGSPKRQSSPKEKYQAPRDAASGSSALGRMADSMIYVSEDHKTKVRTIHASHRDEADEVYRLEFRDGRLRLPNLNVDISAVENPHLTPTEVLILQGYTFAQIKDADLNVSQAGYYRAKQRLAARGLLGSLK